MLEMNLLSTFVSNIGEDRANAHAVLAMTGMNGNPFHVAQKLREALVKPVVEAYNPPFLQQVDDAILPIPRRFIQEQLQEPEDGWPACANSLTCEGLNLYNVPREERFVVRAFFKRYELREVNGRSLPTPAALLQTARTCILCNRVQYMRSFVSLRENCEGLVEMLGAADHAVITDIPGEYTMESTICSKPNAFEGIIKPCILHNRRQYKMEMHNGKKMYRELYKYPPTSMKDMPPNRDCHNSSQTYMQEGKDPNLLEEDEGRTHTVSEDPTTNNNNAYDAGEEILHQAF